MGAPSGVGIGLRRELEDAVLATSRRIDWLEIVPENFAGAEGRSARVLDACRERFTIVPHGVSLSVGGPDDMVPYAVEMAKLARHLDAPYFSDHLSYSTIGGIQSFDLLPLPLCEEAVTHVAARARRASELLERPLVLENITYYAIMPGSTMSEPEFVRAVVERADCGLLLDLNNLYVNAVNHGRCAEADLLAMPLGRVRQVHLAGATREGDLLLDTHNRPVASEVWALFRTLISKIGPVPTLLEWDQDIPSLDVVLDEADRAREILFAGARVAA